jgi:hypothetical protein
MDMPSLYSLVRPESQNHDVMLTEESNSSKTGCASSAHAHLSLPFKTKVTDFLGLTGQKKWASFLSYC